MKTSNEPQNNEEAKLSRYENIIAVLYNEFKKKPDTFTMTTEDILAFQELIDKGIIKEEDSPDECVVENVTKDILDFFDKVEGKDTIKDINHEGNYGDSFDLSSIDCLDISFDINNKLCEIYEEVRNIPVLEHIKHDLCEYIGDVTALRLERTILDTMLCFEVDSEVGSYDIEVIINSLGVVRFVNDIETTRLLVDKFDKIQAVANFWIRLKDYSFKGSSRDAFEAVRRTLMEVSDEDINKLKEASTILKTYFTYVDIANSIKSELDNNSIDGVRLNADDMSIAIDLDTVIDKKKMMSLINSYEEYTLLTRDENGKYKFDVREVSWKLLANYVNARSNK